VSDPGPAASLHARGDMQTGDVLMSYSPVSDATSATTSSPGRSPVRRQCHNGLPAHSHDNNNTTMLDSRYTHEVQSSRACEKCRASKRKCDKKLPSCDRCLRYDFILHASWFNSPALRLFPSDSLSPLEKRTKHAARPSGMPGYRAPYLGDIPCFSCVGFCFACL